MKSIVLSFFLALIPVLTPPNLWAFKFANFNSNDYDNDGLPNKLEEVLRTSAMAADTDGDGLTDAEEIARNADPLVPDGAANGNISVGITSYSYHSGGNVQLKTFFVAYLPTGINPASVRVIPAHIIGVDPNRLIAELPDAYPNNPNATSRTLSLSGGNRLLVTSIDMGANELNELLVNGKLAYGVRLRVNNGVPSAAVADTYYISKLNYIYKMERVFTLGLMASGNQSCVAKMCLPTMISVGTTPPSPQASLSGGGGGIVYKPLNPLPEPKSIAGQVCLQNTSPSGFVGSEIILGIDSSECQPMDTHCSNDCPNAAGGEIRVMDPAALAGG